MILAKIASLIWTPKGKSWLIKDIHKTLMSLEATFIAVHIYRKKSNPTRRLKKTQFRKQTVINSHIKLLWMVKICLWKEVIERRNHYHGHIFKLVGRRHQKATKHRNQNYSLKNLYQVRKIDSLLTTPCFNALYPKINLNYKGVAIMFL